MGGLYGLAYESHWITVGDVAIEVPKGISGSMIVNSNDQVEAGPVPIIGELHDSKNLAGHYLFQKNKTKEEKLKQLTLMEHEKDSLTHKKVIYTLKNDLLNAIGFKSCRIKALNFQQTSVLAPIHITLTVELIYTPEEKNNQKNPAKLKTGTESTEIEEAAKADKNQASSVKKKKSALLSYMDEGAGKLLEGIEGFLK